ncbi:MAG: KH domain-containing protein [Fervidicoccaceae archaeon]|jgi:ribosomal RNA assembly protein|uniref:RNA-processing protein n=1 Tax=Fervidicoccus fontis TaxID=683846 RepID=A0A7C2YJQ5_9CREN|nr:MAG: RNA-processing protein [Fervidicoccus sp.]HEU97811.1 RNA-processing protein [Fervidicoccus fontis]
MPEEIRRINTMKVFELIPVERIGVVIGPGGNTKERIEVSTGTIITVDSKTGSVTIEPTSGNISSDALLRARDIVRAIALGFTPEQAFRLLEEDQVLEIIDLSSIVEGENHLRRIKGRIIGEEGKTRKIIEETTGADIVIGEKAIGIIGDFEQVKIAEEAIRMLIEGKPHSAVYSFLEREARSMKRKRMTDLWKK